MTSAATGHGCGAGLTARGRWRTALGDLAAGSATWSGGAGTAGMAGGPRHRLTRESPGPRCSAMMLLPPGRPPEDGQGQLVNMKMTAAHGELAEKVWLAGGAEDRLAGAGAEAGADFGALAA